MRTKSILSVLALAAASLLWLACTKTPETELSVSEKIANFDANAGTKSINVTCNVSWTVSGGDAWVTVSPNQGSGNGSIVISVRENTTFDARMAEVKVTAAEKSETIKINQLGLTPSIALSTDKLDLDCTQAYAEVTVTSNASWTVEVPVGVDWITIAPMQGTGNGVLALTIAANAGFEARQAEVTVKAEDKTAKLTINQAALVPSISIDKDKATVSHLGEVVKVNVTANAPWAVSLDDNCDWLTLEPAAGEGDAEVIISVSENFALAERKAVIVFAETVAGNSVSLEIAQEMAPASRQTDSLALVAVYNAVGDPANWKEDRLWDLSAPIDTWYGVKLDEEGRVTQLKFLKGTITAAWTLPEEIGNLDKMQDLRFIDCKLTGAIPESIYELTELVSLYFTNNTPTWSLSPRIVNFPNLKDLYIDQNANLSGDLPKEIGQLKKLVNINISQTSVGGAVPAELSGCESLKNFMAYKTNLNALPDNFDQWPSLALIQLYGNPGLTGAIPASIGHVQKATSVWLYECNFEGNVPESFGSLPATCKQLRIQDNKLQGVVPATVQEHANWESWNAAKYILPQQDGYGLTLE